MFCARRLAFLSQIELEEIKIKTQNQEFCFKMPRNASLIFTLRLKKEKKKEEETSFVTNYWHDQM